MIVDLHVHVKGVHLGPPNDPAALKITRTDTPVPTAFSFEDELRELATVDKACVFGIWWSTRADDERHAQSNVNDDTAKLVALDTDKLIGFMSVHPDEPDALDEMDRCIDDLGFKGMKMGPNYQIFDPHGEAAYRVFEHAQRRGIPILFHQGTSPMRAAPLHYAHPLAMDKVALDFPDLKIVMAHMGHPWFADTIAVIRKHPNVYADVSGLFYRPWSMYNGLLLVTEWDVWHKLLFASDFPIATPADTMAGLRAVNDVVDGSALPRVPLERIEEVIHRDSLSLLGIEA